jgi:selenocysteine lyase/cysteine desulfurase
MQIREQFSMPRGHYLLSHSVGCLPVGAQADLARRYFDPWRDLGGDAWAAWLGEIGRFRGLLGSLIGAPAAAICPQVNVSGALAKILHALPQRRGRHRLLLSEEDFPSLGFVLQAAAKLGYEPVFLPRGAASEDLDVWRAALDDRTQMALVTHAFSNRSARLPVAEITALARARGVTTVVDATQTAGVVPIDVADWSADFLVGSCVKYLCGGPGAGYLWACAEALAQSDPIDTGWFSHANPFAFDIHDFRPAADALRFWGGTPSIAPFVLAAGALELLLEFGVGAIHAHNQQLISRLHDMVPADVIRSARAPQGRGNTVLLQVRDEAQARTALREADVLADGRDGCIRVSPHLYNDAGDLDRLVEVLTPYF